MMQLRDVPIRRKLMLVILLTTGLVILTTRTAFVTYELMNYRRALVDQLQVTARIVATNSTAALAFNARKDADEVLGALRAERYLTAAALYDGQGRIFSRYPAGTPDAALPARPGGGFAFEGGRLRGFQPVAEGDKVLGSLYLELNAGAMLRSWLIGALSLTGTILATALLLTYLVARALQHRISQPILALADTARSVREQRDFSVRATKHGNDEIGQLTDAFNAMLGEIQQQHREVGQLNHELEQRVADRTAQLEAANKELEAFSYSISHDLRAPLRHIDGYAQMLLKRVGSRIDETEQRYFNVIVGSTRGLGTLIDELLAFSRMGRKELNQSQFEMGALVAEVIAELEADTAGRTVEWRLGPLPVVEADHSMLRQVWRNLLSNAVKYTRGRDVARIEIFHEATEDRHVFSVRDNGAGFEMQYAHKLFGVFQRLHTDGEFEGTGIGLANVRRIVQRHGGDVTAVGAVDAGATFSFSLPLRSNSKLT